MRTQQRGVTIREVARQAGVSVATVSRVFNDSPLVVKETQEKIRRIARKLNYVPNGSARSLSMKKTETVGLLLPDMHGEFFSEIIRGADAVARNFRYHLLVSSSHSDSEALATAIRMMRGRIDGLIVMSPYLESDTLSSHSPGSLPTIVLNSPLPNLPFDCFKIDNTGGAEQMTRHLIEQGHRNIAIIRGDERNSDARERLNGFLHAMKKASIAVRREYIVMGDFTEESGYRGAIQLLTLQQPPGAVFASNDEMALGALRAFRERGLRVPHDIAVGGFDDIQMASLIHPSLTTVHISISELGSLAVHRLFELLKNKTHRHTPQSIVLPTALVVRESTRSAAVPVFD